MLDASPLAPGPLAAQLAQQLADGTRASRWPRMLADGAAQKQFQAQAEREGRRQLAALTAAAAAPGAETAQPAQAPQNPKVPGAAACRTRTQFKQPSVE